MSAWGGYVFIINLIPLHVFVLLLMGRYSNRLYTGYCAFYIVGTLCSMQIPFVGFQPIRTSEHMAAAGIFLFMNTLNIELPSGHIVFKQVYESKQYKHQPTFSKCLGYNEINTVGI